MEVGNEGLQSKVRVPPQRGSMAAATTTAPVIAPKPKVQINIPKPNAAPTFHIAKIFSVKAWTDEGQGTKILLYGPSGIGKTTLATLAPNPVFIGLDDGARKIRNPKTNQPVQAVMGVVTFQDLRDAVSQSDLVPVGGTLVIDTVTQAQKLAEIYTFEHVKVAKEVPKSLEDYGYGKGYRFLCETMRLLLTDLDRVIQRGINVLLIAQDSPHRVPNLEGMDYLRAGPELDVHGVPNVLSEYHQWTDHIFRINNPPPNVRIENSQAKKGKATGSYGQQIYTKGDLHFMAKNRTNGTMPEVVSFAEPGDDSLWQFLFGGTVA